MTRPDLNSYSAPRTSDEAHEVPDLPELADPVTSASPAAARKRDEPVLNTRLDREIRDKLDDLKRVSPIPRATLRQTLEAAIANEWERTFGKGAKRRH